MSRNQFISLCLAYDVAPVIALECQEVRDALAARNVEAVETALKNNF